MKITAHIDTTDMSSSAVSKLGIDISDSIDTITRNAWASVSNILFLT